MKSLCVLIDAFREKGAGCEMQWCLWISKDQHYCRKSNNHFTFGSILWPYCISVITAFFLCYTFGSLYAWSCLSDSSSSRAYDYHGKMLFLGEVCAAAWCWLAGVWCFATESRWPQTWFITRRGKFCRGSA